MMTTPPAHTQHALPKGGKKFQDNNKKENSKTKRKTNLQPPITLLTMIPKNKLGSPATVPKPC